MEIFLTSPSEHTQLNRFYVNHANFNLLLNHTNMRARSRVFSSPSSSFFSISFGFLPNFNGTMEKFHTHTQSGN